MPKKSKLKESLNSCCICTRSYSSKYLAQCLKCSQDGTVFICDECQAQHDHHNDPSSSLQEDNCLANDELVKDFARLTNINLKQAKQLWSSNRMKLVDINSRVGKVIVAYFNSSNVSQKKYEVDYIWSTKRKSVDKKFDAIPFDTSNTILLWHGHRDLAKLLADGHQIVRGRFPECLIFYDRNMCNVFMNYYGKHKSSGVVDLSEVCIDQIDTVGAYKKTQYNYYRAHSNWDKGVFKILGRNVPDPSVSEYIGTCKVPVGQTVASLKFDDQQASGFNSYWVGMDSRVRLRFIVHYKEI